MEDPNYRVGQTKTQRMKLGVRAYVEPRTSLFEKFFFHLVRVLKKVE